jgi:uncharacterized protein (TIGR00299 family) protein
MTKRPATLYLECATGISGDMTVAALLDLGANRDGLMRALASLRVEGCDIRAAQTTRKGIAGCDFDVIIEDETREHHHCHGEHANDHRCLRDVLEIIDRGELTPRARDTARKIFRIVAEAEAKAHGLPVGDVRFHEVGAIDSIIDVAAAAYCLDDLGIEKVLAPRLSDGNGTIRCQHGELPVPVPAVANIAAAHGIPLRILDVETELVTPTGAAIAAATRTDEPLPENFTVARIGIGLGKRDIGRPNFLRAMLIAPEKAPVSPGPHEQAPYTLIESNVDDSTGEQLGLAMERLMAAGALDVHYVPCFMKKNRPAYLLRVICQTCDVPALEDVIFRGTTTIGVRRTPFERTALEREQIVVELPYGAVAVQKCLWGNEIFHYPEFESVKALADASGKPFADVYAEAKVAARG